MMDDRAPSPFSGPAATAYPSAAYGSNAGYGSAYPTGTPVTDAHPAATGRLLESDLVLAKRAHERGALLYILAWILIAAALPTMAGGIGILIGNSSSSQGQDLLMAALGLLGAGMAVRGIGFSLMMKADFLIRAHAWLGSRSQ